MFMNLVPAKVGSACALSLVLMAWVLPESALAQSGGAGATRAMAAPGAPASKPVADGTVQPMKRKAQRRKSGPVCEAVDDPWGNLCVIREHAETSCGDLTPAKSMKGRTHASRRAQATAATVRDLRKECIDAYMRNV